MIIEILKEKKHFSPTEEILADYLLNHLDVLNKMSARFIAGEINTAPSTISRFVKKVGYQNFELFKTALNEEHLYLTSHFNQINPNYPFNIEDKNMVVANKMAILYQETIEDVLTLLNHDQLQKCLQLLKKAKTIHICSSGVQLDIAKSFKDKMLKIGKNVIIEEKMDEVFYRASFVTKEDVFIVISYSGETESMLRVARKIKARKIPSIAITSLGKHSLLNCVDEVLYVSTREKLIENLGSFSMSLSTLYLLDVLYVNLFNEDYQHHLTNKIKSASEFEKYRKSTNPLIKDE